MLQQHGIAAFHEVHRITVHENIPFTAVYFSSYEPATKFLDWRRVKDSSQPLKIRLMLSKQNGRLKEK